ncbi:snaclec A10-like isoform X1 [Mercenaria mercenaria]|uniref:snaclec A10-like isoform X1 n=1 Tax=Mercenaria mercenaria TaxID=6596 RepID=UPI00234FA799|nr:snaclec A10-like isoform X1 [Mercenaria mercenaria]XP_053389710.1 snaclec A10-like isoform X1 [Mercenaria mercenaria]XP_053389712.1 snaclec A10-like isoform X1 [Mercenaria mercenaria]
MKTLVFLIVILTSLFQDLNAKACCSNGWIAYNSHCYFVGYEARTFSEAHHFCTQREAYLVRIDDYLENNFLKNMLKRSNGKIKHLYLFVICSTQQMPRKGRLYSFDGCHERQNRPLSRT